MSMPTFLYTYYMSVYIYIHLRLHTRPALKKNRKKTNFCLLGVGGYRSLWAAGQADNTWEHTAIMTGAPFGAKA